MYKIIKISTFIANNTILYFNLEALGYINSLEIRF